MPSTSTPLLKLLGTHNRRLIACERCPRLRIYCAGIAERRRRAYLHEEYWGKPVPSFGDPQARLLILGLAPGAHGSNRTGRPFTGDGSGNFLYPVLYDAGFASQPIATSPDDGMKLHDAWITSVVRCAPPDNKPTPKNNATAHPGWMKNWRCCRASTSSSALARSRGMAIGRT